MSGVCFVLRITRERISGGWLVLRNTDDVLQPLGFEKAYD